MIFFRRHKKWLLLSAIGVFIVAGGGASTLIVGCGPFTDVAGGQCPFILELYYSGIAAGTSPTTFDPNASTTRGQVAVFMGAGINYIKRTDNPFRVASKLNTNLFNFNYNNHATGNTIYPNGICSDGGWTYVAHQGSTKIDVFNNLYDQFNGFNYSMVNTSNRLACNATYIWAASFYGNTVARVNHVTGAVDDPWITLPTDQAGDIATNGLTIAVTHNTGVSVYSMNGVLAGTADLGGFAYGVVVDQNLNYWANTYTTLYRINSSGAITLTVPLSNNNGLDGYYPVFDGSSIWVPLGVNGIDIVSTAGAIIEHKNVSDGGAGTLSVQGGAFDGRRVYFSYLGNYQSCGAANQPLVVAYDAASHIQQGGILGLCGDGVIFSMGFDGRNLHALTYNNPGKHYVW